MITNMFAPISYLVSVTEPLAFIINGSEVSSEFIINTISSTNAELNRILCVGTEGNRQLLLHVITTNLSGLTQYSINTQNYSAAIEITIKTQNLPILFKSTLTCTSIGSRENVSLIITHSEYTKLVTCTIIIHMYVCCYSELHYIIGFLPILCTCTQIITKHAIPISNDILAT